MKYTDIILFALITFSFITAQDLKDNIDLTYAFDENKSLPQFFYKRMTGKIGDNLIIHMNLLKKDTSLSGSYYYEKIGIPIEFYYTSRIDEEGNIYIEESSDKYDENYRHIPSGVFKGKFESDRIISGLWENPSTGKNFPFILEESYPNGSAMFDMKNYSENYKDLATIEFLFPHMYDYPKEEVQNSLNRIVLKMNFSDEEYSSRTIDEMYECYMNNYIDRYKNEVENDSIMSQYTMRYSSNTETLVIFNSDYIVSLSSLGYFYEGGAHGNTNIQLASINLHTGKPIELDNILTGNYKPVLNKIGVKKIQEYYNFDPAKDLSDAGLFVSTKEFSVNDNFAIVAGGLMFQFNQYEIAAYAMGAPKILIEYSAIKEFIKEGSIIGGWKIE